MLHMKLGSLCGVVCRVVKMSLGRVRMVRGCFVVPCLVVLGGLAMMSRGVIVVLGCLVMVLGCLLRHLWLLSGLSELGALH
jgi:hypothetical protein